MNYAIGDVQGCFNQLQILLNKIQFDEKKDTLWFTGDLVNRGSQSLQTLRFIKNLGDKHHIVLGNHDLHLLAVSHSAHPGWPEDTLTDILTAPDCKELIDWLIKQPLLHHDENLGVTMVHAGLAPSWDLQKAIALAYEASCVLQSEKANEFFKVMYSNQPNQWNDDLQSFDRCRVITNYFTRVRFCYLDGRIELSNKGKIDTGTAELVPWFKVPHRKNADLKIIFGHWAALGGVTGTPNVLALDTGCAWGYSLTAMRLEDQERFKVDCDSTRSVPR